MEVHTLSHIAVEYPERSSISDTPLSDEEVRKIHAYWSASNYLSVGQIYLRKNPLLREPLAAAHIKERLLGHWGTTPGINFIYAHLNRVIKKYDANMLYIIGPGHGGPALFAHTYLEGSYTERYPEITQDVSGMETLFRQFSWPGGVPSHVAPEVPGSIHEGGELGYSLLHAYGAVLDNRDLIAACIVGDGEAETGPCATSWHSNKFIDPRRDGSVLPILHLNGYKIAGPSFLARLEEAELFRLFEGYGYTPYLVQGSEPTFMHQSMAATLDCAMQTVTLNGSVTGGQPLWAGPDIDATNEEQLMPEVSQPGLYIYRQNFVLHLRAYKIDSLTPIKGSLELALPVKIQRQQAATSTITENVTSSGAKQTLVEFTIQKDGWLSIEDFPEIPHKLILEKFSASSFFLFLKR